MRVLACRGRGLIGRPRVCRWVRVLPRIPQRPITPDPIYQLAQGLALQLAHTLRRYPHDPRHIAYPHHRLDRPLRRRALDSMRRLRATRRTRGIERRRQSQTLHTSQRTTAPLRRLRYPSRSEWDVLLRQCLIRIGHTSWLCGCATTTHSPRPDRRLSTASRCSTLTVSAG